METSTAAKKIYVKNFLIGRIWNAYVATKFFLFHRKTRTQPQTKTLRVRIVSSESFAYKAVLIIFGVMLWNLNCLINYTLAIYP